RDLAGGPRSSRGLLAACRRRRARRVERPTAPEGASDLLFWERREWDLNPRNPEAQRFSRPSDSAALASLREGSLGLRRRSSLSEKGPEEAAGLGFADAGDHGHVVVEAGIGGEVVEAAAGAGLGIGRPEHHRSDAGGQRRAG